MKEWDEKWKEKDYRMVQMKKYKSIKEIKKVKEKGIGKKTVGKSEATESKISDKRSRYVRGYGARSSLTSLD